MPRALNHFCAHTQSAEVLILSTCNRVEIYSDAPSKEAVIDWFHTYHEQAQSYHDHFYAFDELDALRHAIRVGAGIDSLVMGEPEILGQLKDAKRTAMQAGCIGVSLEMFMNHAVNAAKQIRHHTAIGHCPISVAYSAIQICKTAVTPHTQILVLGAGDTVKKLLQHLPSCAKAHVTVMNRSFERAQDLAHAFQVKAAEWADLPKHLHQAGIILSAIHTETPIIRADSFTTREHPLLILDLSVPRSIHPDVESLPMTRLIAIDDIDAYIAENTSQ
ncbi:MAG: hypothetical protein EBX40_06750, partial [Gammaproteobacteria bacterium]|nr:hypothetical protein [Gammaproteobacteria bacterium]